MIVTVQWTHNGTMSDVFSMRSPFISTLTLSPLSMTDAGQYSCVATADSSSQYISTSSQGHSSDMTLSVTSMLTSCIQCHTNGCLLPLALPAPGVNISFSGNSTAGYNYSLVCSASVVDGLVVLPDIKIVPTVLSVVNTSSVEDMFSPLRTSDGGQYTCTATINIPQTGITNLSGSAMEAITVAS